MKAPKTRAFPRRRYDSSNLPRLVCMIASQSFLVEEIEHLLAEGEYGLEAFEVSPCPPADLPEAIFQHYSSYIIENNGSTTLTSSWIASLLQRCPGARVLVLDDSFSDSGAFQLLAAGARGLITYFEMTHQLLRALHKVFAGGYWVPRVVQSRFLDEVVLNQRARPVLSGPELSARDNQVLKLVLENLSNADISDRLKIPEPRVKSYITNVLSKFGVGRRADLILLWYQTRPVAPPGTAVL
jgi:DNA-binding NarL/FixJ family response regulator